MPLAVVVMPFALFDSGYYSDNRSNLALRLGLVGYHLDLGLLVGLPAVYLIVATTRIS